MLSAIISSVKVLDFYSFCSVFMMKKSSKINLQRKDTAEKQVTKFSIDKLVVNLRYIAGDFSYLCDYNL